MTPTMCAECEAKELEIKRLRGLLAEARKIVAQSDSTLGELVEIMFFEPLRKAEDRIRLLEMQLRELATGGVR